MEGKVVTLFAVWEPAKISREWLWPRWKLACEMVDIKPYDVQIDINKKHIKFSAQRDKRNGSSAGLPAMFLTQPGGHYAILGCAIKLMQEFKILNAKLESPKIIVDLGSRNG